LGRRSARIGSGSVEGGRRGAVSPGFPHVQTLDMARDPRLKAEPGRKWSDRKHGRRAGPTVGLVPTKRGVGAAGGDRPDPADIRGREAGACVRAWRGRQRGLHRRLGVARGEFVRKRGETGSPAWVAISRPGKKSMGVRGCGSVNPGRVRTWRGWWNRWPRCRRMPPSPRVGQGQRRLV
jgi:hypothetical protein